MKSYLNLKFYSWDKTVIQIIKSNLKKYLKKDHSLVFLPIKKNPLAIRVGPSGRGFANFKKYNLSLRRGFCRVYNLKNMNLAMKCFNLPGVYLQSSIEESSARIA